jgi:hypothetical protein
MGDPWTRGKCCGRRQNPTWPYTVGPVIYYLEPREPEPDLTVNPVFFSATNPHIPKSTPTCFGGARQKLDENSKHEMIDSHRHIR